LSLLIVVDCEKPFSTLHESHHALRIIVVMVHMT
jgi:hypothetical protein